jgi:gluconokinase
MLSYDSAVKVASNGPSSAADVATALPTTPAATTLNRLTPSAMPNSSTTSGAANAAVQPNGLHSSKDHHIWLVTGPAGCGKTTVAKHIADTLHMAYVEGDEVCNFTKISLDPIHFLSGTNY